LQQDGDRDRADLPSVAIPLGMKTHIELDDELLEQVFRLGGFATKKAAVNTALAEYVKLLKRRELLEMRGKIPWEGDLNEMRADRRSRR
jgi:Arc/MetJ family transcription regulator